MIAEETTIRLDPRDNVVLARTALAAGAPLEDFTALEDIPAGHKAAVRPIRKGEPIVKGGAAIGVASGDIAPGERVHAGRVMAAAAAPEHQQPAATRAAQPLPPAQRATFRGIVRDGGEVATRNYIGVLVTVNCAATVARRIAAHFDAARLARFPNVDGVVPFVHELGCGMEMTGEPMELLRRTLGGTIRNPNLGAAVVVGLGCERNNIQGFLEQEKLVPGPRLKTLVMQEHGGTAGTIALGIAAVEQMLPLVNDVKRVPVSAEHITLGVQSAAVDAFAGLTANPALGVAVDLLVRNGGTAIISATSELRGVEGRLAARAASPEVADKLARRIEWWRQPRGRDAGMRKPAMPANDAAGIASATERALIAAKRWGAAPLADVYRYAEPVKASGLVFMDSPAYEAISATGQMAGGANVMCLTTGRGSAYGSLPAPTIKIASNTPAYLRMQDDIDIDCGAILEGEASVEEMGRRIFDSILRVASGERTCAEAMGVGENEFVPWPIGVFS